MKVKVSNSYLVSAFKYSLAYEKYTYRQGQRQQPKSLY